LSAVRIVEISAKFEVTKFNRKGGMKSGTGVEAGKWQSDLQTLTTVVCALAEGCQGDSLALLALLRRLEELHREIREGLFQASLPDNRQALYALVKDIETKGGWPYIERMKLQSLLAKLSAEFASDGSEKRAGEGEQGNLLPSC